MSGILLVLSVGSALLIGEFAVRLWGGYSTWSERNLHGYASPYKQQLSQPWFGDLGKNRVFRYPQPEFDFEVVTNSEGLREVDYAEEKPPGEYRIIALGDSFTEGVGAAFDHTWPKKLEFFLNQGCYGKRVTVMNGGVSGSDPVFELELLRRRLLKYQPDMVIQAVNDTDIEDIVTRGGLDRFEPDGMMKERVAPWCEWAWARSHLFRLLMMNIFGYDWFLLSPAEKPLKEKQALETILLVAKSIRELGYEHSFRYLVVGHPLHYHCLNAKNAYKIESLQALLRSEDIEYLDLRPTFIKEIRTGPERIGEYFWKLDWHCNMRGYELWARTIDSKIRQSVCPHGHTSLSEFQSPQGEMSRGTP